MSLNLILLAIDVLGLIVVGLISYPNLIFIYFSEIFEISGFEVTIHDTVPDSTGLKIFYIFNKFYDLFWENFVKEVY